MVTIELIIITVTNQNKQDCQTKETEKKAKAEQLALFAKSRSSDTRGSSRGNKKRLKESKKKAETYR